MKQQKKTNMPPSVFQKDIISFGDIRPHAIKGWEEYLREGGQYLNTARSAYTNNRRAFTAEILYNLITMAIEKLVMGALMRSGNLPYNHTMHDLVEAMEEFLPGRLTGLKDRLIALDAYQEICDLDTYNRKPPGMEEIPAMLALATELQNLVDNRTGSSFGQKP